MIPLNGNKTHPLSDKALEALGSIERQAQPTQVFNPGIVDRLVRGNLARIVQMESPYKTRRGMIPHLEITSHGEMELKEREE